MGASVAISSAALASSAAAQHTSNEAKRIACESFVNTYNATTATVQAAKQYGYCINLLHPDPATPYNLIGLKIMVGLMILSYIVGFVVGWFKEESFIDAFVYGFLGLFVGFIGSLILTGVGFLFT